MVLGDYHSKLKTPDHYTKAIYYIERAQTYQNVNDTTRGAILQSKALIYFFLINWIVLSFISINPIPIPMKVLTNALTACIWASVIIN